MMFSDPWFYAAVVFALLFLVLAIFHFKNPMPLIQMPELPHHLYFVPPKERDVLVRILAEAGHEPFGQFKQGVDQVLLQNGTTVIAGRESDSPAAALVIPVKGKKSLESVKNSAARLLALAGIEALQEAIPGTGGLITRFHVDGQLGFDIAFRPPGRVMGKTLGFPKFKKAKLH